MANVVPIAREFDQNDVKSDGKCYSDSKCCSEGTFLCQNLVQVNKLVQESRHGKKSRKVKFGTDRTMVSASLCSKLWIMNIFGTIGSNPRRAALDPLLQGWGV